MNSPPGPHALKRRPRGGFCAVLPDDLEVGQLDPRILAMSRSNVDGADAATISGHGRNREVDTTAESLDCQVGAVDDNAGGGLVPCEIDVDLASTQVFQNRSHRGDVGTTPSGGFACDPACGISHGSVLT